MVTFYNICNIDKFLKMINGCIGRVMFVASDGCCIDIKNNNLLRELINVICHDNCLDKLTLKIENQQDMPRILNYLLSCKSIPSLKPIHTEEG